MKHVPNSTERYIEEKQGISNLVFKFHKCQGKTQRSLCWLNRTSSKPDLTEYLPRTSKISFLPYVGKILNFFSKKNRPWTNKVSLQATKIEGDITTDISNEMTSGQCLKTWHLVEVCLHKWSLFHKDDDLISQILDSRDNYHKEILYSSIGSLCGAHILRVNLGLQENHNHKIN